ncbi:MAG: UDP-N-acetylmuramoyl-L-alanine--D-glutamate ligase, partial [Lachnospiraceae bacterium]|nr:UDP-N-acetylmuramoyl-L-alanine--D-glutamate ligase [Lachnospiraceae bacterium]
MELQNKKVTVVGAGISGIAAVDLLTGAGAIVTLYDGNQDLSENEVRAKLCPAFCGSFVFGEFSEELKKNTEILVMSPGVPVDLPFVEELKSAGVPVIGEIELAYLFSKGKIVAVTGTNGKTTTTALTGEIMRTYYENVLVVGNIGTPYTSLVKTTDDAAVTVAEISSFQLETVESFRPDVSMILNITPDHLNRHHTMDNYIAAKEAIAANQTAQDVCILNYEDEVLRAFGEQVKSRVLYFSSVRNLEEGLYVEDDIIFYAHEGIAEYIIKVDELNIIGKHNHENAMAAIGAG